MSYNLVKTDLRHTVSPRLVVQCDKRDSNNSNLSKSENLNMFSVKQFIYN